MSIAASDVKALRDRTGAGMMDAKRALEEANGDPEKAHEILRIKGQAKAAKRGEREAGEGVVASYIHSNDRIGVLVEVNCETDFVARTDEFKQFARDIAIHIAGAGALPRWVSEDDVPDEELERERQVLAQQADTSKPPEVQQKMTEGRLRKWLEEVVLLNQEHVHTDKHEERTIEQLRAEISTRTGENVVIRRFARFQVGD
jgi:elongation factor Ts